MFIQQPTLETLIAILSGLVLWAAYGVYQWISTHSARAIFIVAMLIWFGIVTIGSVVGLAMWISS